MAQVNAYYDVTVRAADGTETQYKEIGGTNVVPSSPPLLILQDREGRQKAIMVLAVGMSVHYTPIEVPALVLAQVAPNIRH